MKRNMTIALLVLTAILCVVATGCGSRKNQTTANDTMNGTTSNHYASSGVPYDQLLDDGRVTDTDGNLNNDTAARNRIR